MLMNAFLRAPARHPRERDQQFESASSSGESGANLILGANPIDGRRGLDPSLLGGDGFELLLPPRRNSPVIVSPSDD
jgi:hypothetical protein